MRKHRGNSSPTKRMEQSHFRKMALAPPTLLTKKEYGVSTQMTGHTEKAAVEMFGHLTVTIIRATFPP